jgi:hypothetical protein
MPVADVEQGGAELAGAAEKFTPPGAGITVHAPA